MSLKDRFVDGVSSLFDKLGDGDTLGAVDPVALERELAKRVALRKEKGDPKPSENKRARLAQAGDKARQQRAALAEKRVARVHAQRSKRAATKKREQDAAFRHMAEEAARNPPPRSSQAPPRTGSGEQQRSSRTPGIFQKKDLAQHYKTLNVEYGADPSTVKKSYRQLMRKYHPDLHQDPRKKKAATELTTKISVAYQAIEDNRKK